MSKSWYTMTSGTLLPHCRLMKYEVIYDQPKKKGYARQVATFLKIDDAILWESHVKEKGCKNITICPR